MTSMDRKYEALLLAVEEGSLSAASRKLHYSQSSISRMIQSLESDWGFRLIDRTPRGVQPTQECRQLLPALKALRRETENLANRVQALRRIEAGKVRIATFSSVATYWLPNMISAFHRDYPQVDFELLIEDYNEIERLVLSGQADLGFLLLPIASQLECTLLYQDPLLAVLPQDHPMAKQRRISLADISRYPFILLKQGQRSEISDLFEEYGLPLKPTYTTLDDYAIMAMVEKNMGVSILPELILQRNNYRIVTRGLTPPARRKIGLASRPREELSPAARRFLDYLTYRTGE